MSVHDEDPPSREQDEAETTALSRRRFIRTAAVGAASAAVVGLGNPADLLAIEVEDEGDVTLDAIMLTYIGAPIGTSSTSSYTLTKTRTSTFRVVAANSRSLRVKPELTIGPFTVGGTTFTQTNSSQVSDAITLRNTSTTRITTPPPGIRENTMILGLREPELHIRGNTNKVLFRFNRANAEFALTVADLESDLRNGTGFKASTIQSFLAQYVTDPARLVKPRFKLKKNIELSANSNSLFSMTKANGSAHSESKTSVFSSEITRRFGFRIPFFSATFEVTARLEFQATSVQEVSTDRIITIESVLNRNVRGVTKVYLDRVWRTFVVIDAGPADHSGAQPTLQGMATDWSGTPIPNAWVYVTQNDTSYMGLTDGSGHYSLGTPRGEPMATGVWPVVCGDLTQNASIGAGATFVSFNGVDPIRAQDGRFYDAVIES